MTAPQYESRPNQSISGFVRSHLATIESEIKAGIALEQIVADIQEQTDFKDLKLKTLKMALYRARQEAKETGGMAAQTPAPASGAAAPASAPAAPVAAGSTAGVKFAKPATSKFEYQPTRPGQDISHLTGSDTKDKK